MEAIHRRGDSQRKAKPESQRNLIFMPIEGTAVLRDRRAHEEPISMRFLVTLKPRDFRSGDVRINKQ
jgi:hypothetical protein